jgi:hypothetical protein
VSSSHLDRVFINSQSRLRSDDFNRQSRFSARALLESISSYALGDVYKAAGLGVGGVVGGFRVRAITGTNTVEVSPGIGMIVSTPDDTLYDPPVAWIELREATIVDLSSLVNPANPRLVTIEIEANEEATVTEALDIFNTVTGTFDSTLGLDTAFGSEPTLYATGGTAAANPVVAGGTIGRLPLAIVKLTTAQASFADENACILLCRPMLSALGDRMLPADYVRGGGLSVGEESAGVVDGLGFLTVGACSASLAGLEADPSGFINYATFGRSVDGTSLASLISAVQPVYAYAAPPPWASDYGSIAPREAWQYNPSEVATSEDGSIIYGEGETFTSLVAETSLTPGRARKNCIVFFDDVAPWGTDIGLGSGAPVRVIDARGPHPVTAPGGGGTIVLDDTQDPTWGTEQEVYEAVYLGSVASIGTANFVGQSYEGAGLVRLIDTVDTLGGNPRRPFTGWTTDQASIALYPSHWPAMLVGDDNIFPTMANIDLFASFTGGTGNATARYTLYNAFGFGKADPGVLVTGAKTVQLNPSTVTDFGVVDEFVRLKPNVSNAVTLYLDCTTATSLVVGVSAYTDAILAAR